MNGLTPLELSSVIGFSGNVSGSLILHNDDTHILYALGSTVVVFNLINNKFDFLQCADESCKNASVSCMKLSNDGSLLATGLSTHSGFPTPVWIWDFAKFKETQEKKVIHKLHLYKTKIQAISFSSSGEYIATLGGSDDNKLVIWNVQTGDAICGSPASNDTAFCVQFCNDNQSNDDNNNNNNSTNQLKLVTCGKYNFRIWNFNPTTRKIRPTDVALGQLKRIFNCIAIDNSNSVIYAGTQSGDILQISIEHCLFQKKGPVNCETFSMGVQSLQINSNCLIVGSGNGICSILDLKTLKCIRKCEIAKNSAITSLQCNKNGDHFFVATNKSQMFLCKFDVSSKNDQNKKRTKKFDFELRNSAHYKEINDIAFPGNFSALFVTAGKNDIRVWNLQNQNELLRINVPNLECHCVLVSDDGKCIVSGWNDGKVRAFYPETGKLMYTIHDCHSAKDGGVTAIALSKTGDKLVTGGHDSLVRIWEIRDTHQKMLASLREHQNVITDIAINDDDTQFISSSCDGSCVVWDLNKCSRNNALFATTQFCSVQYHPDQSQLITCGTDRQIAYWDATDLSTIRIVIGSDEGAINKLSISNDGSCFVSAGDDGLVKLWDYDAGVVRAVGKAHSGSIKSIKISPDNQYIVSVGDEGAICIWNMPQMEIIKEH